MSIGPTTDPLEHLAQAPPVDQPTGHDGAARGPVTGSQPIEFKEVFKGLGVKDEAPVGARAGGLPGALPRAPAARAIILAAAYFVCAVIGVALATGPDAMTLFWPAPALLLTVLLRSAPSTWPACLAACLPAAIAANAMSGISLPTAGALAVVEILEMALAAHLIRRVFGLPFALDGQTKAIGLFALAGIIAPAFGACLGAGVMALAGQGPFSAAWTTWWSRAAVSTLIVAPTMLCWTRECLKTLAPREKLLEFAVMVTSAAAVAFFAFDWRLTAALYIGAPVLIWAAVRLGPLATAVGSLAMIVAAELALKISSGPFAAGDIADNAPMSFGLAALTVPAFIVAIVVHEREQAEKKAARAHNELMDAIESMPASFIQYDAEGKLVRWNSQAAKFLNIVKDKLTIGAYVRDIIRSRIQRIFPDMPPAAIDKKVNARFERFRNPGPAVQEQLPNGRWAEMYERRTADGGTVSIQVDISERKMVEKRLNLIAKSVSGTVGEAFLGNMLTSLREALDADNAFICQRVPGFSLRLMTVDSALDGERWRGLDFDVVGTPHAAVIEEGARSFNGRLRSRYPSDPFLATGKFKSYLGVPLQVEGGKLSGVLCVLSKRTFKQPRSALALMRIFADRAAAELERLQAESETRAVKSRMEQILTAAGEGIFGLDTNGNVTFVNPAAGCMLGWRQDDLVGRNMHAVIHGDRSERAAVPVEKCPVCAALREERRNGVTCEMFSRKDGDSFPVEYTSTPIDDHGMHAGSVVVFRDVTERRTAEDAKRESDQRFRDLIEGSIQGILIHRGDALLFFNDAWARIHGYNPEEMAAIGSRRRFVAPHERQRLAAYGADRLAGKPAPEKYEYQALKKDGSLIWVENMARRIVWEGQPALQTTIIDITERRLTEIQGKERQAELTHANRLSMLGEMATGLAHELNQPLSAIANYAQGTARRIKAGKNGTEMVLESVEKIAGQALRAGGIIRRMRDFARKEIPQKTMLDVNALVCEAIELLQSELHGNDFTVDLDLEDGLPWAMADGIQIQQVVLNIARNAWEAMRDGHSKKPVLSIRTRGNGEFIKVSIQDTGPGIPDEIKENVFTPFFSTKTGGLGMGLAISRSIIDEHGGEVTFAAATPRRGTVIHFTLPILEVSS